jgi:hypothetical protein
VESGTEAADSPQVKGQKIKEERPVRFRGQGDHLALLFIDRLIENMLQVRCLTAQTGAVINDLAVNFPCGKVNKAQDSPSTLAGANCSFAAPNSHVAERLFYIITDLKRGAASNSTLFAGVPNPVTPAAINKSNLGLWRLL